MAQPPSTPDPAPEIIESRRMKDLPEDARPREAAQRYGLDTLSNDMLLAILLGTGIQGKNAVTLAQEILEAFNGLPGLARADYDEILRANIDGKKILGIGPAKAIILAAAVELGRRFLEPDVINNAAALTDPACIAELMFPITTRFNQEGFWVLHLDNRRRLIGRPAQITLGLLNQTQVDARVVFRRAVQLDSSAIILIHNHPSGDVSPSPRDIETTDLLIGASRTLGIPILDHVIIGVPDVKPGFYSLRRNGCCRFE